MADSIDMKNIIAYRLQTHHLDTKVLMKDLAEAAGACGLQNSPPGAWETALFNRLRMCLFPGYRTRCTGKRALCRPGAIGEFRRFFLRIRRICF